MPKNKGKSRRRKRNPAPGSCTTAQRVVAPMLQTALSYVSSGDHAQAEAICREALERAPDCADAHFVLGRVLALREEFAAAAAALARSVELDPDRPAFRLSLGKCLHAQGDIEPAMRIFRDAISRFPREAALFDGLGLAALDAGDLGCAESSFRTALALDETIPGVSLNLARSKRFVAFDQDARRIAVLLERTDLPDAGISDVHFALAKIHDDCRQIESASRHYLRANALIKAEVRFDDARHEQVVSRIIETFSAELFERCAEFGDPALAPVFIVGMPRSGTTLVEQILASHSQVYGAGELPHLNRISGLVSNRLGSSLNYPASIAELDRDSAAWLGAQYVAALGELPAGVHRVTDKLPANFLHLGLIALMLPNASIVHCSRDPLDTVLSIFCQQFENGHEWAYDAYDIAAFYAQYRRLIAHWHQCLPGRLLNVPYEQLITSQEQTSRALVEFCALEWEPGCLEFHRRGGAVGSASNWQVRQPIYTTSVARWQRYALFLPELATAMSGLAMDSPGPGN